MNWLDGFQKLSDAVNLAIPTFRQDRLPTLIEYQTMVWFQVMETLQGGSQAWNMTEGIDRVTQNAMNDSRVGMNHALLWESVEKNGFEISLKDMIDTFRNLLSQWTQMSTWDFLDLARRYAYWASNSEQWKDQLIDAIFKEFTTLLKSFYTYVFWRAIGNYWRLTWDNLLGEAVRIEKFPLTDSYFKQIQVRIEILHRLFSEES